MPDDRLIHRTLGHSEKIGRLTDFEFIVWLTYKLAADDFGLMRFSAVTLQDAEQRLERKPAKAVQRALECVKGVGLIDTFGHQGRLYAFDAKWQSWQKITHPRQTSQPLPPAELIATCDLNTQWLFSHHPKGGQIGSWQHPDLRPKKTSKLQEDEGKHADSSKEGLPKQTGSPQVELPACVCVGVCVCGGGGVRGGSAAGRAGVLAGTLPRDHLYCRQPCIRVCISQKQHAILRERHGGTDADLDAFYAEVRARLSPDVPIGDTPWKFWEAQFAARFGTVAVVNPRTAGNFAAKERFVARGKV